MLSTTPAACIGAEDVSPDVWTPQEVVRRAVQNELQSLEKQTYHLWFDRVQRPMNSTTRVMVETPSGIIGRIISVRDIPLTPEQKQQEDARIYRLLDPGKMRNKAARQREDKERFARILSAIPQAFLFKQVEPTRDMQARGTVVYKFSPTPAYSPSGTETQVLPSLQGEVTVDLTAMRMVKIGAFLFKDVTLGFGLVGKRVQMRPHNELYVVAEHCPKCGVCHFTRGIAAARGSSRNCALTAAILCRGDARTIGLTSALLF